METLLISACLIGFDCKYSGGNNALPAEELRELRKMYRLIPACPELAGGLPVPRDPSERQGDKVVSVRGRNVTAEFTRGAEITLSLARRFGCTKAIMKLNSPSCGNGTIYDGSFSGRLTAGDGLTAELLKAHGITIIGK